MATQVGSKLKRMRFETWERTFKPQRNPRRETTDRFDGAYYETYGEDQDDVLAIARTDPDRVWTEVFDDRDRLVIVHGWHYVNRNAYFITAVAGDPDLEYSIR